MGGLKKNRGTFLSYLSVLLFLVASGSAYFFMYNAGITFVAFFCVAILWAIRNNARFQSNLFFVTYLLLIILSIIIYGFNINIFGYFMLLLSTMCVTTGFSFKKFREVYMNILLVMCVVSLLLQLLYSLGAFTPILYGSGKNGLHGHYIYLFHVFGGGQWGINSRISGIFWEPGIFQMVINTGLLLNLGLLDKNSCVKWRKLKLTLLGLTLALTKSTTGYLVMGLIIVGWYRRKARHSQKYTIISIFAVLIFGIIIIFSPVVADKFSEDNASFLVRFNDLLGLLQAIWIRPLYGLGVFSDLYAQIVAKLGMTQSQSAGILLQTAQLGFLWPITFYLACAKEYRRRAIPLPRYIYLMAITFMGLGEPLAYTPLILFNALPFKNYKS